MSKTASHGKKLFSMVLIEKIFENKGFIRAAKGPSLPDGPKEENCMTFPWSYGRSRQRSPVSDTAISDILILSQQKTVPLSYTEDKHVSKPTMTYKSVLVHETI